MSDTPTLVEPPEHVHVDPELLEIYEVLEFVGHEAVRGTFPEPRMSSSLRGYPLPNGFVSRGQWGARPWTSRTSLTTARGNTAHWEGPRMGPFPHSSCPTKVRGIQAYHMSKGWADLAYSSIECPHGAIYEGRWFGWRTAANGTNIGNDRSYAHCVLMGIGDPFTVEAKLALREAFLHFEARGSGTTRSDHNDWKSTQCPGTEVERFVKVDNLWVPSSGPSPSPTPVSPLVLIDTVEIDMQLNTYAISIGTTAPGLAFEGCGHVKVPYRRNQIKGFTPPGLRPAVDNNYKTVEVGFAEDEGQTTISVTGWAPGWPALVEITVAE